MRRERLDILLIDDDENDIFFVRNALEAGSGPHTLQAVTSVEEGVRYLRAQEQYANRATFPIPNIVLTDLKMPGLTGFDFLRWLRKHPECSIIPTIMYSSSELEADVREAYRLGANAYFAKPQQPGELLEMLTHTYQFWSRCICPSMPASCF